MEVLEKRISLAQLPTPVQPLSRISGDLDGPEIYIKRDDLTGIGISGNKVRKLEYSAASAMEQDCKVLITCGGIQSNHARATAAVAAKLGLCCHLVLSGSKPEVPEGNHFLDLMFGAEITYAPDIDLKGFQDLLDEIAENYRSRGMKPYVIPLGASDPTGSLGYINAVREMIPQFMDLGIMPDHIVCATGSAGTLSGLLAGKSLFGLPSKLNAFSVAFDSSSIRNSVDRIIDGLAKSYFPGLDCNSSEIRIFEDYICGGYTRTNQDQLSFIRKMASLEGVLMDPTYTGKAFFGLAQEIIRGSFKKGESVLFIHTGGVFGLFPYRETIQEEIFSK
ncbi:MAG: D-cysteine desulfhydrase family protein [Synergistales bacterium]|nr:D-cysteine desulfhydrase family protein [Synergistales bacterium]